MLYEGSRIKPFFLFGTGALKGASKIYDKKHSLIVTASPPYVPRVPQRRVELRVSSVWDQHVLAVVGQR